jgi:hypothetical protein
MQPHGDSACCEEANGNHYYTVSVGRLYDIIASGGWREILGCPGEVGYYKDAVGSFGVKAGGRRVAGF